MRKLVIKERGLAYQCYTVHAKLFRQGDKPVCVFIDAANFGGPAVNLTRKQAERLGRWMLQAAKEKTK